MNSLPSNLRRLLESAVKKAHRAADAGARKALESLAVHEADPYPHMNPTQRQLRKRLQAQARQMGDGESLARPGQYEIRHLAEKVAYDQWHRLLFARFLLENDLLISPDHGVTVSLDDCEELAPSLGLQGAWPVASLFTSRQLPEIFRADDPAGEIVLAAEDRNALLGLLTELPAEIFRAGDSLGWTYQFWQAERKEQVNKAGIKIGADELPAVTQLFTEDYMVDFLLDNTLGAWHAGKVLARNPRLAETAETEVELRQAVALPDCPWTYLRFVRNDHGTWAPAAGTFAGWPKTAKELKCLDPCMGSGHFVVAMFQRLVALRLAEEALDEPAAVTAVIRDNLFGLEIDPRCTQIAAFNLALAAWRRVGHCRLPAMNLACSGLAPNAKLEDWLKLAETAARGTAFAPREDLFGAREETLLTSKLKAGMERLYRLFEQAPVLGSLIDPRASAGDMYEAGFQELQPLLEEALAQETTDSVTHEMAVTARGLAKAAEILAGHFTLVATNVPYLGRGKQYDELKAYCERIHPEAKADLATCFVERCFDFCASGNSVALVTPQNWLFLGSYKVVRQRLIREDSWRAVARLGPGAFATIGGEVVNVTLLVIDAAKPGATNKFVGVDVSERDTPRAKADGLCGDAMALITQAGQLQNPNTVITFEEPGLIPTLERFADAPNGSHGGDSLRHRRVFWELNEASIVWRFLQGTVETTSNYGGREHMFSWFDNGAQHKDNPNAYIKGENIWGKSGVVVSMMQKLPVTIYSGDVFDIMCTPIVPRNPQHMLAVWAFCSSWEYSVAVRKIDQKLNVTNATLAKVPFDLEHWQQVAAEKFPDGLPKPFSSDPTQWLFDGHPVGSDQPLHVAVARLLGYRWPRQTGSSFPDCPALGPDGLEPLADSDGIVCLSTARGEPPAAERLRELMRHAWGENWNATVLEELLAQAGYAGKTLEEWLRDGFFEQHCKLFHNRPFIWHIWDGHRDGFAALVNYHTLDRAKLESLTYAYLGDWIRRQQAAVEAGEAGSDARLEAARRLQQRLQEIIEGEPPFDLFVRWKPLHEQPIGWDPDLNDGVRLNIRPFMARDIPGGKKGAGILRVKPGSIKWDKDRGKEPFRAKEDYPWFWGWDGTRIDFPGLGDAPDGSRWNDCHYTNASKRKARERHATR